MTQPPSSGSGHRLFELERETSLRERLVARDEQALAELVETATPWLVIPLFAWWIDRRFIAQEEVMLEERFGAEYVEFRKRVPRWV